MNVTLNSAVAESRTSSSSSKAFVDLKDNGFKFKSPVLHNKADEVSKSTSSVYESSRPAGLVHRSNSYDRLQSPVHEKHTQPDGDFDQRCESNESFLSLVKRFEAGLDGSDNSFNPNSILYAKRHDRSYESLDSKSIDSQSSSTTSSPSLERKRIALKQRNSFKGGSSIFRRLKNTGPDVKNAEMETGSKDTRLMPRKGFAHFDCQSMIFDFEEILKLRLQHSDGMRPRNTTTGASAARQNASVATDKPQRGSGSSNDDPEELDDMGDGRKNELVLNCPFFRNELGGEDTRHVTLSRDCYYKCERKDSNVTRYTTISNPIKQGKSSMDVLMTAYDTTRQGQLRTVNVAVLDNASIESKEREGNDGKSDDRVKVLFEHVDYGAYYFRDLFVGNEHFNYFGIDERFGPVAVSLRRERVEDNLDHIGEDVTDGMSGPKYQYRAVLRCSEQQALRGAVVEEAIPSTSRHGTSRSLPHKDVLEHLAPELNLSCLKLASTGTKVIDQLLKLDEQSICQQYKVGILYCKADQSTEEEMYNNEHAESSFDEFLDLLGDRVVLKGFEGYRAQLDNRNDSTGEYSLYTKFHEREIMFHVSTLLPLTPNNKQQLLRKRHIGNDIVTIIFQEPGALPFTPKNIRSHFQHVFIVVRVYNPCSENTYYRVAVSRSKDVPPFGPPIPKGAKFGKSKTFADFLLTKVINAENAAHKSEKFSAMAIRTRFEYLKELCNDYVSSTTLETGAKFGKFGLTSKKKEKEKNCPFTSSEMFSRGALIWTVIVEDFTDNSLRRCVLGISFDTIVVMDPAAKESIFCIHTKAVIGWTPSARSLKLWYSNGDCIVFNLPEDDSTDVQEIIRRLEIVTKGCQTEEIRLSRNKLGQLGFHVHFEGLVADVEQSGMAWVAGLRQGSRLVEISGVVVATVSHDQMIDLLRRPGNVEVTVIPPFSSGKPRKGVVGLRHQPRYSSVNSISSVGSASSGERITNDEQSTGKSKFYISNNTRENSTVPSFPPESFGQSSILPQGGRDPWVPLTSSHKSPASQRRNMVNMNSTQSPVLSYLVSSATPQARLANITAAPSYGIAYSLTANSDTQINSSNSSSSGVIHSVSSLSSVENDHSSTPKNMTVSQKSWSMESIPLDSGRSSGSMTPDSKKLTAHAYTEPRPVAPPRLHRGAKSFRLPSQNSPHKRQDGLNRSMNEKHSRRGNPLSPTKPDATVASYSTSSGTVYALSQANTFPRTPKRTPVGDFNNLMPKRIQEDEKRAIKAKSLGYVDSGSRLENIKGTSLGSGLKVVSGKNKPRVKWYEGEDEVMDRRDGKDSEPGLEEQRSYKETMLGPEITTVQTSLRKEREDERSMSDTMDQIERAFGFPPVDKAMESPISRIPATRASQRNLRMTPRHILADQDSSEKNKTDSRESLSMRSFRSDSPRSTDSGQIASDRSRKSSGSSSISDGPDSRENTYKPEKKTEVTFFQVGERKGVHDRKLSEPTVTSSDVPQINHSKSYSVPDESKSAKKLTVRTRVNTINSQASPHTIRDSDYIIIENPLKLNQSLSSTSDLYSPTETSLSAGVEARSKRRRKQPQDTNNDKNSERSQVYALVSVPISRAPVVEEAPIVSPEKDVDFAEDREGVRQLEEDSQSTSSSVSEDKLTVRRFAFSGHVLTSSDDSHSEGGVFSPSEHYSTGFAISSTDESSGIVRQTETLLESATQSQGKMIQVEDEALESLKKASKALEQLEKLTSEKNTKDGDAVVGEKSSKKSRSARKKEKKKQKRSRAPVVRRHSFDDSFLGKDMALSGEAQSFPYSKDTKRKIAELEMQVSFLSNDLNNEREEKRRLQKDLKQARDEISRLHEQNRIAASQLRKFTEWLFASMEQPQTK